MDVIINILTLLVLIRRTLIEKSTYAWLSNDYCFFPRQSFADAEIGENLR